jgi:hypothetical protein
LYEIPAEALRPVSALMAARIRRAVSRASGMFLQVLGDVEIGLVARQRLDDPSMFGEDGADLQRDFAVDVETRFQENQLGALATRGDRRHRGADAELPRFIACSRHDATFAGASDGDRLAAQIRLVALFDEGAKRIHVDMNDLARPPRGGRRAADVGGITDHCPGIPYAVAGPRVSPVNN